MTPRTILKGPIDPHRIQDSDYEFDTGGPSLDGHTHTYLSNREILTPLNGFANYSSTTVPLSIYTIGNLVKLEAFLDRATLITTVTPIKIADIPSNYLPAFLPIGLKSIGTINLSPPNPNGFIHNVGINVNGEIIYTPDLFYGNYTIVTLLFASAYWLLK